MVRAYYLVKGKSRRIIEDYNHNKWLLMLLRSILLVSFPNNFPFIQNHSAIVVHLHQGFTVAKMVTLIG